MLWKRGSPERSLRSRNIRRQCLCAPGSASSVPRGPDTRPRSSHCDLPRRRSRHTASWKNLSRNNPEQEEYGVGCRCFTTVGWKTEKSEKSGRVERQSHVVFGKHCRSGARTRYIVELRQMNVMRESRFVLEAVQHGSHPPRESLAFPNAAQAALSVLANPLAFSTLVQIHKRTCQHAHVRHREVQPFCPGRWHDVCRIAEEK